MLNQKGFSIAQVMVAMTIMSIMSVGLSTMIQNQSNTVFYLEDQMSHQNLKKEVETLLSDTTACTESLSGIRVPAQLVSLAPNAANEFVIKDSAGVVKYNPANNNRNKFDKLEISNIRVQNQNIAAAATDGRINIMVDVRRDRGPSRNQALKSIQIQKEVTLDAGRNVTGCSNIGDDALGVGDCLENISGASLGTYYSTTQRRMVTSSASRVPANAKVMKIVLPGGSCSGGSSSAPNGGNDWSSSLAGAEITIILNGKSSISGTKLVSGGNLNIRQGRRGQDLYYNNLLLANIGTCGNLGNRPHSTYIGSSSVSMCHKGSDFRQPTSVSQMSGFSSFTSSAPASVTYWK